MRSQPAAAANRPSPLASSFAAAESPRTAAQKELTICDLPDPLLLKILACGCSGLDRRLRRLSLEASASSAPAPCQQHIFAALTQSLRSRSAASYNLIALITSTIH